MAGEPRSGGESTLRLAVVAVLVGVATAAGVWLFKRMIAGAEWLAHGWFADSWAEVAVPWVVLVPVLGGLLVGMLLHLFSIPEEPGHGVEEVIEAVTLGVDEFPEREIPVKVSAAALSLGAGAALGPEDPAVEIGGGLGHLVGRKAGLPHDGVQALVAAGAAGGLSAAFHAPFAAIVFAVEVFALRLLSRTVALVAITALTAYLLIGLLSPGVEPVVPAYALGSGWEVALGLGLGLLAGALSAGQIHLMYTLEHAFIRWRTPPRWLKPALGGLLLGAAGLAFPELLGIGYRTLEPILAGELPGAGLLLALALGKALLMAVSFGSGFLGGFFAPSFFIGAALGGAYGLGAQALLPALALEPALFAVAGMAALLAGAVRAPFTAVLLVAALSGHFALAPLLLVATLSAYWTSRALERDSLYTYGITHPAAKPPPLAGDGQPESDVDTGSGSLGRRS